jgi:hypothetical protein
LLVAGIAVLFGISAPASAVPHDEVIPLIELENVRLPDALRQMARKARLNVIVDPRLSMPPFNEMTVSIRWDNVTARDALTALLENYDLMLVEMPGGRFFTEGNQRTKFFEKSQYLQFVSLIAFAFIASSLASIVN